MIYDYGCCLRVTSLSSRRFFGLLDLREFQRDFGINVNLVDNLTRSVAGK